MKRALALAFAIYVLVPLATLAGMLLAAWVLS